MELLVFLVFSVVFLIIGTSLFGAFRSLFGPHWMRNQVRSHFREMQSLSQELQSFAAQMRPPGAADQSLAVNCPACGAPATDRREVSPSGDVRCEHCGRWFNVKNG